MEIEFENKENKTYNSEKWIVRKFYGSDEESLKRFQQESEDNFIRKSVKDIFDLEYRIETSVNKVLKGIYRRRNIGGERKHKETVWFTKIRERIEEKKRYNKSRRKPREAKKRKKNGRRHIQKKSKG